MDRLESMSILLEVVKAGSFSAAGRKLGVPLATVSRKISDLETFLGTRIFNRSTRQFALTEAGLTYVEACERILEELREAEKAVAGEYRAPRGNLTIASPVVFGRMHLVPVVVEFLNAYPDIDVRIVLADRVPERMIDLVREHIDLAVRIGRLPDSSMHASKIGTAQFTVCGSPRYFAERGTPSDPDDLDSHLCVTFEGLNSPTGWNYVRDGVELVAPIRSRLIVNTAQAAIEAAAAGFGITRVLSYQVKDLIESGEMISILNQFMPKQYDVNIVYANQPNLPQKIRAFIDFSGPRLKSRLA
ncbi:LysR family transcriptional regulator [Bosea sp. R86505]|uniref:LysR family transcriptional regulator n=1 Tax=Bosea sp. R86505 TaxID=3101710 RepID=UPI003671177C